jgi:hypothetical protein
MSDGEAVIEDFHVNQLVMATVAHHDSVLSTTDHDPAAGHAVDGYARMTIQVDTCAGLGDGRVPRLAAVGQRGVAAAVDDYSAVVPSRGGPLDGDVIPADGERMITLSTRNSRIGR